MYILTFTLLEMKLFFRNAVKAFSSIAIPVILLLLMGGIYGNKPDATGYGMVDYSMPGYIGIIIAFTGLMSLPVSVTQYRERKILKRLRATPTHPIDLLISQVAVNLIITIIGFLLLLIVGKLMYQIHIAIKIIQLILALFIATISIFTIGLVIASFCRDVKTATAVSFLKNAWLGNGLLRQPMDLIVLGSVILLGLIILMNTFRWE